MSGSVGLDISQGIARVTLSHPGKFNAMSRAMWLELRSVFQAIQQNLRISCVLVAGEGGHFCAGGDISEYAAFRFAEDSLRHFHENEVWGGLQAMLDCDLPIVAMIDGNCMGAGVEIASCCDIRIATDAARFGAPIAKLGFPMAPREAALVMRAVGELTAREMLLAASVFDAAEMKQRGFLNQTVSAHEAALAIQKLLDRICKLAPGAARMNKQSFRVLAPVLSRPAADLMASAYQYADSAEHREGISAFVQKRPPQF
ncbi:MAG: enoyl-CoA hydratase/isomerase family protein [Pseudomonadota bacterium]